MNIFNINNPYPTYELNTRQTRLLYAAQVALGKKTCLNVIDYGGGKGDYFIALRRHFPNTRINYQCIDFSIKEKNY